MEPPELTPATYESGKKNRYRPPLPWGRIGLLVIFVAMIVGGYVWRQRTRADALRDRMRDTYQTRVLPVTGGLSRLQARLEEQALSAKGGAANRLVDPDLRLSELHDDEVVYLRLRATDLQSEETLEAAIESMSDDAIGACLGLELIPMSKLSEVPKLLTEEWVEAAEATDDMMRLRVREEQLRTAIALELPKLAELRDADYFLLVVVQGKNRLDDPVDTFVWDLKEDRLLLRTRTENHGRLITVRSQIGPTGDNEEEAKGDPIVVADCSLAAHLKAQLGEPTMSLEGSD